MLVGFILLFSGCNQPSKEDLALSKGHDLELEIKNIFIDENKIILNSAEGKWYYKNQLFNGYLVSYHENGELAKKTGFSNGIREGKTLAFFSNGTQKKEAFYKENKLHGIKLTFYGDGTLASESNYVNGKKHGVQKVWYASGQLAKKRGLNQGVEEGLQQAWLNNGALYVNYEAKNGRIFGMRRANSCYKLEDEKVIKNEQL